MDVKVLSEPYITSGEIQGENHIFSLLIEIAFVVLEDFKNTIFITKPSLLN